LSWVLIQQRFEPWRDGESDELGESLGIGSICGVGGDRSPIVANEDRIIGIEFVSEFGGEFDRVPAEFAFGVVTVRGGIAGGVSTHEWRNSGEAGVCESIEDRGHRSRVVWKAVETERQPVTVTSVQTLERQSVRLDPPSFEMWIDRLAAHGSISTRIPIVIFAVGCRRTSPIR
jgi:hypothetical protein